MKPTYEKPLTPEELAALPDCDIDTSDIPILDEEFWSKAVVNPPRKNANRQDVGNDCSQTGFKAGTWDSFPPDELEVIVDRLKAFLKT